MTGPSYNLRSLQRQPGVALYAVLVSEIERLIGAGLRPGDALPSETELQSTFAVSRATVRQALATLERRGLVERHQGRGTFVTLPLMERDLPELTGFSEHVRSRGMRPSSELVEYRTLVAGGEGDARLFAEGTPLIRVVRIRRANEVAVGVHTVYLPLEVAARIGFTEEVLKADRSTSLYGLLDRGGIRLAAGDEHLRARSADATESRLLGVRHTTPVMSVLRKSWDERANLIEVVRAVYLGDKYDYVVRLDRGVGEAAFGGLVTADRRDLTEEEIVR